MINSNPRKLRLSGWLKENGSSEYNSPLKLQKFLFFYEMFSKIEGDEADFSSLKGYKKDLFSVMSGEITHTKRQPLIQNPKMLIKMGVIKSTKAEPRKAISLLLS